VNYGRLGIRGNRTWDQISPESDWSQERGQNDGDRIILPIPDLCLGCGTEFTGTAVSMPMNSQNIGPLPCLLSVSAPTGIARI